MAEAGRTGTGSPAGPPGPEVELLKLRAPFRQIKPRSSLSAGGAAQKDSFICFKRESLATTDALFSRNEESLQPSAGGNEEPRRTLPFTLAGCWKTTYNLFIYVSIYFRGH